MNLLEDYGIEGIIDGRPVKVAVVDGQPVEVAVLKMAQANEWVQRVRRELSPLERTAQRAASEDQTKEANALALAEANAAVFEKMVDLLADYFKRAGCLVPVDNLTYGQALNAYNTISQIVDPMPASALLRLCGAEALSKAQKAIMSR